MGNYRFDRKHVLVTGATGGLGSALVRRLADMGASLVLSARSEVALRELVAYLPEGTSAAVIPADLSVPGEAERLAQEAMASGGRIDVLINNAGIGYFALLEEATQESIRHLFEVNTLSPIMLIKMLLPQMKAAGSGRIINIVSSAGRVPIPSVSVYGGSKSALAVMANTMRLEVSSSGIDIINIYPGTVDTAFEENALRERERPGLCALDRCGSPRFDIADQVLKAAAGSAGEFWLEPPGKWLSAASILWPRAVDKRLARIREKVVVESPAEERRWRLLQVESAIACNLNCIMCPWKETSRNAANDGRMSPRVWDAILPYLPEVDSLDLTGGGEPLLQPRLLEWVGEAKSAGCRTGFITNGLLLTAERSRALVDMGLDWICFSIDGATKEIYEQIRQGSSFDRVCANVKAIAEMRKSGTPKIMVNFVVMPMNAHQLADIVSLASGLGVDQVNYKQCDVIRGDHGKGLGLFSPQESKEIRRLEKALGKARKTARRLGVETTAFAFSPDEQPVCDQDPRNSMFVRYDGSVGPCINLAIGGETTFLGEPAIMPTVLYGRLPEDDLLDLWHTKTCAAYRERFLSRAKAYDRAMTDRLIGGSGTNYPKLLKHAKEAMPPPLAGCSVCHYLYNI